MNCIAERLHFPALTSVLPIPSFLLQRRALCPEYNFGDFYCRNAA
jgi:hypothetical protein